MNKKKNEEKGRRRKYSYENHNFNSKISEESVIPPSTLAWNDRGEASL